MANLQRQSRELSPDVIFNFSSDEEDDPGKAGRSYEDGGLAGGSQQNIMASEELKFMSKRKPLQDLSQNIAKKRCSNDGSQPLQKSNSNLFPEDFKSDLDSEESDEETLAIKILRLKKTPKSGLSKDEVKKASRVSADDEIVIVSQEENEPPIKHRRSFKRSFDRILSSDDDDKVQTKSSKIEKGNKPESNSEVGISQSENEEQSSIDLEQNAIVTAVFPSNSETVASDLESPASDYAEKVPSEDETIVISDNSENLERPQRQAHKRSFIKYVPSDDDDDEVPSKSSKKRSKYVESDNDSDSSYSSAEGSPGPDSSPEVEVSQNVQGVQNSISTNPAFWQSGGLPSGSNALKFHRPSTIHGENRVIEYGQQMQLTVEKIKEIQIALNSLPPCDEVAIHPDNIKATLKTHQLQGLNFMKWRETQNPACGIIADEMGLGKTGLAISLIVAQKHQQIKMKARRLRDNHLGGTLIVAPASLIHQWYSEFGKFCKKGTLNVYKFHGADREKRSKTLALTYDVVLTSYALVTQAVNQKNSIFRVTWDRIILDEGHIIRSHNTQQAKACFELQAKKRWVLTGTPVQNKEQDLFALIKFLRIAPFSDLLVWRRFIESHYESKDRLKLLLTSVMLRRTKAQLEESGVIQKLPEKEIIEIRLTLSDQEQIVNDFFMSFSQAIFSKFLEQRMAKNPEMLEIFKRRGGEVVNNLRTKFQAIFNTRRVEQHHILVLLMRLRQMACHPCLILRQLPDEEDLDVFTDDEQGNDDNDSDDDDRDQPGPSNRVRRSKVPAFDLMLELNRLMEAEEMDQEIAASQGLEAPKVNFLSRSNPVFEIDRASTKIIHLLPLIRDKLQNNEKVIAVSSFTSFLDILAKFLGENGINYCIFSGKTSIPNRNEMVNEFNKPNSKIQVMLLSMLAGSVGLNLTGANNMFLLDLYWNPQLELQAMDRIHRFGQIKKVTIVKFITNDSIEDHILKIQKKKLDIAKAALGEGKPTSNKLTLEDMMQLFGMGPDQQGTNRAAPNPRYNRRSIPRPNALPGSAQALIRTPSQVRLEQLSRSNLP